MDKITIEERKLGHRFDSSLLSFNADYFKGRVHTVIHQANTKPAWFFFNAESVPLLDITRGRTHWTRSGLNSPNKVLFSRWHAQKGGFACCWSTRVSMTESEQNTYCRLCALVLKVFSQRDNAAEVALVSCSRLVISDEEAI